VAVFLFDIGIYDPAELNDLAELIDELFNAISIPVAEKLPPFCAGTA
jgi:hypothetical protein